MKELSKIATVLQTSVSDLCEEPPQVLTQSVSTPGLAYWGEVADNIRVLMNSGDNKKIAIIRPMLLDSLEIDEENKHEDHRNIKATQTNYGRDAIMNF